ITAYTGLDPSEHGILESVNYFAKGEDRVKVDTSAFQGRTFWDRAGEAGRRVCVINPFMAYPVWPVNGVMVNGPVFISGKIQVSDLALLEGICAPESLGGIVDFPSKKTLGAFCEKVFNDTREQAAFGRELFGCVQPDLFFQAFLTSDRLKHFLWRFGDPEDPAWPGPNRFEKTIEDFYQLMDEEIGRFADLLGPGDRLVVVSDHGHGMRCTHVFNVNEFLRQRGDVVSRARAFGPKRLLEYAKNAFLSIMARLDLQDYVKVVAKLIPGARKIKKGKHLTDNSRNRAYVSDFTGTNPFGGICINRSLVEDYEEFRESLMKDLARLEYEGKPVFLWIRKREEMFGGAFLDRFPDILFAMQPELGVNWGLHAKMFAKNPTHKALSGGHREMGVILSTGALEPEASLDRLYGSVLAFWGIQARDSTSGSLFRQ
ncbi:alkaline phosphatase family protein, partial [bacterium]|nr:alkaline phosphatase family protein [bacterium]